MITAQQFLDAVADFEGLIAEGCETDAAVIQAAESNEIDPATFEARLTREIGLEARVEKIRHDAEYNRFLSVAQREVEAWKIGEMLDPFGTHLKMTKGKDPEMTKILLRRQLDC